MACVGYLYLSILCGFFLTMPVFGRRQILSRAWPRLTNSWNADTGWHLIPLQVIMTLFWAIWRKITSPPATWYEECAARKGHVFALGDFLSPASVSISSWVCFGALKDSSPPESVNTLNRTAITFQRNKEPCRDYGAAAFATIISHLSLLRHGKPNVITRSRFLSPVFS